MSTLDPNCPQEDDRNSGVGWFLKFPEVIEDKIDTEQFLIASRGVVQLIDKFGKLFAPVKYDMHGNIEKLNSRFVMDEEVNGSLQDMLMMEITIGESMIATDALLWLTRGLHMIQLFFEKIVGDARSRKASEDLVALLKKSYEESLEPYHGWMAKQLFGLLSRMVPSRTQLLQILADDLLDKEEMTLDAMDVLARSLKKNVIAVQQFYLQHNI